MEPEIHPEMTTEAENHKYEVIHWIDQDYLCGPIERAEALDYDTKAFTVGIVVAENEELVALAAEYFPHAESYRHIIRIPKVCILKRRILK